MSYFCSIKCLIEFGGKYGPRIDDTLLILIFTETKNKTSKHLCHHESSEVTYDCVLWHYGTL
jgi:hypothetical protein